ncbi:efflux RND transporter permease subunit [bacterium]|nr:efflux RND transporter permease subunit [bacterium]
MNIWEWSVRRPIGITMITLIIVLFGAVSLHHLPIDLMPDITYPTISISATYENASPVEIESLVTRPIEQAISAVTGVEEVSSNSTEGRCSVRVQFIWGTDLDAAANDIRDRLDRILSRLPEGVERPILRKFDLANFPILNLGISSKLDPVQLLKLIEDQVKYRLERIPGVAAVDINGGRKREIHVNLDPERLKAMNLRLEPVIAKLKQENLNLPAGIIEVGNYEFTIRTPGEFFQVDQIKDIVVFENGSSLIRLGDVATIIDKWEKVRQVIRVNGQPGLRLAINKQSGKNTVEVAEAVLEEVAQINQDLPQVKISSLVDTSKYIKRSIKNVSSSAISGSILAVLILLIFIGDWRSTLIIGTSIPLSIVSTFALMYYNGFTLNIMSLGGVALGTGMLVDNSIVVLENIFRFCEGGKNPIDAAIEGAGEVAAPILASTLTTLVIFLPLLFVEGMTGLMFKQLSYVVCFSLSCSLLVSITLIPMLCSKFRLGSANKNDPANHSSVSLVKRFLGFFEERYLEILSWVLRWRKLTLLIVASVLAGCLALLPRITTEFMPAADEGEVRVSAEMEIGSRLSLVEEKMKQIELIILDSVPELECVVVSIGGGGGGGQGRINRGEFRIPLLDRAKRKRSSSRIASELRTVLAKVPGVKVRTREGQGLFIFRLGASNADKVQVQVRGHNVEKADNLAKKVEKALFQIDGVSDVQISRESGAPERLISIDRRRASDQKLTIQKVASFLETLLSGARAGNYREGGDEYRILVRAKDAEFMSLEEIMDLTILNAENNPVAIRNVAGVVSRTGPVVLERLDQERIINVTADSGERPLGVVLAEAREKLRGIRCFLAIILVYMVMAVQYESFLDPFIVMVTVPLSSIGVILIMVITQTSLNVQSFIGIIMLGGIVVNNSILLVDHANLLFRDRKLALIPALLEAGRDRFRPVLMTALTTILGLIPLALGWGEGGEVQAPLARVVIGGLTCSTFVSLVFIPVVYHFFYYSVTEKQQETRNSLNVSPPCN